MEIAAIKELRKDLDSVAGLVISLPTSREVALSRTAFETSKMMLGKVLSLAGEPNPYPESKNAQSDKIEPTADKGKKIEFDPSFTHIGKVKFVRESAEMIAGSIALAHTMGAQRSTIDLYFEQSFLECQKGLMWLGMELGRIRDLEQSNVPEPAAGQQA